MNETNLTEKDKNILGVISHYPGGISPTSIGIALYQPYPQASSYCSYSLKKLMNAGLIVKITTDRVLYKIKRK